MSLGGFAEGPWVVDGDWEAFNYCTAENYYDSMIGEEWDLLGEMSCDLLDKIVFWLCENDPEVGIGYNADAIYAGTFKTYKDRTFIDAIVDAKKEDYAETYIRLEVYDIRLYILCMFKTDKYTIDECFGGTILNYINYSKMNDEERLKFLTSIFSELERVYNDLIGREKKKQFLDVVYKNAKNFRWPVRGEKVDLDSCISKPFRRILTNKDKKGE